MTSFEIGVLMVLGTFLIFGVINRICDCVEKTSAWKNIDKLVITNEPDLAETLNKIAEEYNNGK